MMTSVEVTGHQKSLEPDTKYLASQKTPSFLASDIVSRQKTSEIRPS